VHCNCRDALPSLLHQVKTEAFVCWNPCCFLFIKDWHHPAYRLSTHVVIKTFHYLPRPGPPAPALTVPPIPGGARWRWPAQDAWQRSLGAADERLPAVRARASGRGSTWSIEPTRNSEIIETRL
jgi:hypothetical protein